MLSKENFTKDYIERLRKQNRLDPMLLERTIYAFGLLEALARVGMPFIFKGGTSLMLLLNKPRRLSTDIDIIVEGDVEIEGYIQDAAKLFPFLGMEEQTRRGKNDIIKRHFKFTYDSPVSGRPFYILLDILFEKNHYSQVTQKNIVNELLLTEEPYFPVTVPTVDCILGDKLTAFAPHTTGIPFGVNKELEIIKQLYDIASLVEMCQSMRDVRGSYLETVQSELQYRGLEITVDEVLADTIDASVCIASRGMYNATEYQYYLNGIRKIVNFIFAERFSGELAVLAACKVFYMAACILKEAPFVRIENSAPYANGRISDERYKKLMTLRKLDLKAFAYAVEAVKLLTE